MAILEVKNIEKHFGATKVLKDVSFSLEEGSTLAVIGSSGSGKTTLLRCLNFLETPDNGTITVRGETLFDAAQSAKEHEKDLRKKRLHFGLVFQSFNLFPQYTALQNVMLSEQLLAKERSDYKQNKKEILAEIEEHGKALLTQMGLADRMDHYPHELSGGQQQRVAIARAVVTNPKLILADEPTGNLDSKNGAEVMNLLTELNKEGTTIIMVTHSQHDASFAHRTVHLFDGSVVASVTA